MNLSFKEYIPEDIPHTVTISDSEADTKPVGWAWVSSREATECILHAIFVQDNHRRKGYAKALIEHLQSCYDTIKTQYSKPLLSSPGIQLCFKCGFKTKPIISKGKGGDLIWCRKTHEKEKN